jgi:hypothetical protein
MLARGVPVERREVGTQEGRIGGQAEWVATIGHEVRRAARDVAGHGWAAAR